jgi:hypothetical protein
MQCDQYECASCAKQPSVQRGSNVFSFFFPQHEAGFTSRRQAIFDPVIYSTLAFLILKIRSGFLALGFITCNHRYPEYLIA